MRFESALLATFIIYFVCLFGLSIRAYRRTHDLGDYILGGRKLGSIVTALSVGASDMSGWLLLGLPGAVYLSGLSEIWIGIGLIIGAYLNWLFVAKRLRLYSQQANNSLTLPDYFDNRFNDETGLLRLLSAIVILLFFTFYTASGLVGGAILFESSFGLAYADALVFGAAIIVAYTFVGGFSGGQLDRCPAGFANACRIVVCSNRGDKQCRWVRRNAGPTAISKFRQH